MLHIIANPASQSGTGKYRIKELMRRLKKEKIKSILHLTAYKGHTRDLIQSLQLSSKDRLLLVGGDGSINELVNALDLPCPVSLLFYPSGSGNDFARGMKISHDINDLLPLLQDSDRFSASKTDIGQISSYSVDTHYFPPLKGHRFAVSCGFGMDAAICHGLETGKLKGICNRLHIGKVSYLIVGVKILLQTGKNKRAKISINADGKTMDFKNTAFVSVHNLPYEGGGFPFAPDASATDGYLDVCIVHVPSRILMIPLLVASLLDGKHTKFRRCVKVLRCKSITVTADRPMPLHTDGEVVLGQIGFTATAEAGVINCIH